MCVGGFIYFTTEIPITHTFQDEGRGDGVVRVEDEGGADGDFAIEDERRGHGGADVEDEGQGDRRKRDRVESVAAAL